MENIKSKMGVIRDGKILIPYMYDQIEPVIVDGKASHTIFKTTNDGKKGVVKYNEEEDSYAFIEENIEFVTDYEDDVAIIATENILGGKLQCLIDTDLNKRACGKYNKIQRVGKGYYKAYSLIGCDLINSYGEVLYENITPATIDGQKSDTLFITENGLNNLFGLVKIGNNTIDVVDNDYTSINEFKDGVAIVTMQHDFQLKYGLLSLEFDELLECIYDQIVRLDSDLYVARKGNEYGVYSVEIQEFFIPLKYSGQDIIKKYSKIKEYFGELYDN